MHRNYQRDSCDLVVVEAWHQMSWHKMSWHWMVKGVISALTLIYGLGTLCQAEEVKASSPLVSSIDIILETPDEAHGDVSDDIWLDLGPHAWKINSNVLTRNTSTTIHIQPIPGNLRVRDLFQVRIEKKGVNGWTGAPDLLFDPLHPARDNRWHPSRITLLFNGQEQRPRIDFPLNIILDKTLPSWRQLMRPLSNDELFVYGLRDELNSVTGHEGEVISGATTLFKQQHISGWQSGSVPSDPELGRAIVTGFVENPPSPGTDGFVSLDLRLESVEIVGKRYVVDGTSSIGEQRYIRVEYCHHANPWPRLHDHVQISGRVRWDTDQGGFFEIHPYDPSDLVVIDANGKQAPPKMPASEIINQSSECDGS